MLSDQEENVEEKKQDSPELAANVFSKLTFSWISDLIKLAFKKQQLDEGDIYKLPPSETVEDIHSKFQNEWKNEINNNNTSPSLVSSLSRAFGKPFYLVAFLKIIYDCLQFVNPFLLNLLIVYLSEGEDSPWGYYYIIILFSSNIIQSMILHQYFKVCFTTGIRLRAALISAIYHKTLYLSLSARINRTIGQITTMLAVDCSKFQDLTSYLHIVWSGPFQIALALYFLHRQMGVSTFAGVGVIIVMIPLTALLTSFLKTLQSSMMKIKDERIKLTSDIFSGITIAKMYAYELLFHRKIAGVRNTELEELKKYLLYSIFSYLIWMVTPITVALATFITFSLTGNELNAAKAFTSLLLFQLLMFPMAMFPRVITSLIEANVAANRIVEYLKEEETPNYRLMKFDSKKCISNSDENAEVKDHTTKLPVLSEVKENDIELPVISEEKENATKLPVISISNASFYWDLEKSKKALTNINLKIKKNSLVMVIGETASGKTALLSALNGDILPSNETTESIENNHSEASFFISGSIGYCSQTPWIQNTTVKKNIISAINVNNSDRLTIKVNSRGLENDDDDTHDKNFPKREFNDYWYHEVISACCLETDLSILPNGEQTFVGEKGVQLSGGQAARLALARCIYAKKDIILLDDVFSALDIVVAKRIFEYLISLKQHSTIILVTNALWMLPMADYIVLLAPSSGEYEHSDSSVLFQGDYSSLLSFSSKFSSNIMSLISEQSSFSSSKPSSITPLKIKPLTLSSKEGKIEEEIRSSGSVKKEIYLSYLLNSGGLLMFFIFGIVGQFLLAGIQIGSSRWIAYWSANVHLHSSTFFIEIFAAFFIGSVILSLFIYLVFTFRSLKASVYYHHTLLTRLLHAPIVFFESTPIGRVLNRFSGDLSTVDNVLNGVMQAYIRQVFHVLGIIVVISVITPWFILCFIPLAILYYYISSYYISTARELKRLDSVYRSPIISLLSESFHGISIIRSFLLFDNFRYRNNQLVNRQNAAYYLSINTNRWLAVRLDLASLFVILGQNVVSPELGGMSISYAMTITQSLNWLVRVTSELESNIVAVERINEYCNVPQEEDVVDDSHEYLLSSDTSKSVSDNINIPIKKLAIQMEKEWPSNGNITFNNVSMRYRDNLPYVLRHLSFNISGGQRIGIVGRTGSGKSSIFLTLLRLVELSSDENNSVGEILIDGVNIRDVSLRDLRTKITIIPQLSILFSGTLRQNLDPYNEHSDEKLIEILQRVNMDRVNFFEKKLETNISETKDLSQGEIQLICLARALLRKAPILLLDEATASIDEYNDQLIQTLLWNPSAIFSNEETLSDNSLTILIIAHRLHTIVNCDCIIIIDEGRILEIGHPKILLESPNSSFKSILDEYEKKGVNNNK